MYCENDINECGPNPCHNNAPCIDLVNGFLCNCTGSGKTLHPFKFNPIRPDLYVVKVGFAGVYVSYFCFNMLIVDTNECLQSMF